jgi:hypothetical protein
MPVNQPLSTDQYNSINAYLATNPTADALAAAQQQYGVTNDQLAAARAYGSTTNPAPAPAVTPTDDWMANQWYNQNLMPGNFDWQRYIGANQDLGKAGIDTQTEAERHYYTYGRNENRNIGALAPTKVGDLSPEDYRAGLAAYRKATGDTGVITGVNGEVGSEYAPVNQWIAQNYIPQGKFVTDYAAAKPVDTFQLLNEKQTSNRPPDQLASIRTAWDANKDDPGKMRQLMEQYGVTLGDLSQATGETYDQLNNWVKNGNLLGSIGFSVNKPGAYDKFKATTTPKYDPDSKIVAGPSTAASREADYLASQQRAANTFDPVAYAKNPETYIKSISQTGNSAADLKSSFGLVDGKTDPGTEGILSGFKYAKEKGLGESAMKQMLGDDAFNTYKTQFSNYAKTGIANILSDNKLSFDEAKEVVKFGREYGYSNQELADLTGQKKELFDTVNKSYDETANKIVDSVLGAEDVKTAGDRILRALALQERYGFTDDDLAKATDLTSAQVKGYLEPVREYSTKYKEVMTKPDVSGKDILSFLEESKKDQNVSSAYGSKIDEQIARLNELNQKWDGFKDSYQAENIYNQVNKITEAAGGKNWSGSWRSGGDNAAKEATRLLLDKGVDNLSDLGVAKNYEKAPATREFYNGQLVRTDEDGRNFILESLHGNNGSPGFKYLPSDAKTVPGKADVAQSGDDYYETYRPLTEQELKTYDPKTKEFDLESGNKLIDKSTGKVIGTSADNRFVLNSYETGNFFKGKSKQMGIMMTDQGIPVPYQTTEKDGLVYSPAFPIMMSMLLPGIGSSLSAALPGAGAAATATSAAVAPTLMNTALTQGILGGGMAALTGQDILKGALLGGIGAPISAGIGSLLPTGMDPNIAKALTSGGTGVVKGLLQGGDFEDLLGQGVLSGLTNYGFGELSKGLGNTLNLTPEQLNLASGIALPLFQGKPVNPMNLIGPLTKIGQQQTTKVTP